MPFSRFISAIVDDFDIPSTDRQSSKKKKKSKRRQDKVVSPLPPSPVDDVKFHGSFTLDRFHFSITAQINQHKITK